MMVRVVVSAMLAMSTSVASASDRPLPTQRCIELISRQFGIDPLPIELLAELEGGWPGAVRRNDNGTEDLGPMQVNSIHLAEFAALGISHEDLRDNRGCRNVFVAVVLYLRHLKDSNGNPAQAIARYHSKTPEHAAKYLGRAAKIIRQRSRADARSDTAKPLAARVR